MPAPPDLDLLPQTAVEIVEIVGHDAAVRLCRALGGASVRFSSAWAAELAAQAAGIDAARKLADHYGAECVYIPRCAALLARERSRAALALIENGATQAQAALASGVSDRAVRNWVSQARRVRPHPDLFDSE